MKTRNSFALASAMLLVSSSLLAQNNTTFDNVCEECHTGGFKGWISGAPDVRYPEEWQEYIERDSLAEMQKIVLNGSGDHKVKGGCKSCSDDDIKGAIDYMMSRVK